jgi:hypothetical protein
MANPKILIEDPLMFENDIPFLGKRISEQSYL